MKHIIERFFKMSTADVFKEFASLPGAKVTRNYVFIQGIRDKPILLVGHADTVFSGPPGSVEWCGNLAKAGMQWSSKTNDAPAPVKKTKHASICACDACKKEKETHQPKQAKVTVVQPSTNVVVPTSGLETVKSFALANGYSIHHIPDMKFEKNGKKWSYAEFIKANMATLFKSGKVPKDLDTGIIKLTDEDVKKYAGSKGFIPFREHGEIQGPIKFMYPPPSTKFVSFEDFCMDHALELLRLKDEKNGIVSASKNYLKPIRRGVYTDAETKCIAAAIEELPDKNHQYLVKGVVDTLAGDGLLVTPEEIKLAGERWAITHPQPTQTTSATTSTSLVTTIPSTPSPYSDNDANGVKMVQEAQVKAQAKEAKSVLVDGGYRGFDPDDVIAFAKNLNFSTVTNYLDTKPKEHTIEFVKGTVKYTWKGFVDRFPFGVEFTRDERINKHPNKMWPLGEDKLGKAREELMKRIAKEEGWETFFPGLTVQSKSDKEKLSMEEFILRYVDKVETEMKKLSDEFKNEDERKVSKNSLKKVTKLVSKIDGAVLNAVEGTVTKDGIVYTIHAFRELHDKKYAASGKKKLPITTTQSVVKSPAAARGYGAMNGQDWGDDSGYGYMGAGSSSGSSYGAGRGLGADDRVGIAMIWMMRKSGHSILITDGEERGGIGAKAAGRELKEELSKHQFAIEIDRNFDQEMVFYNVATVAFKEYMVQQTDGFHIGIGTYTDIADVCEEAGICGVNLAAGYWNQHTSSEMFSYDAWLRTFNVVRAMLYDREHPRFPLPKYEPPKQGAASSPTVTSARALIGQGTHVLDAALAGGKVAPVSQYIGEGWAYHQKEDAWFPQSTSAATITQDDDRTLLDVPPVGMSEMQADGADEVEAETRVKSKGTKNQSVRGLGVPVTDDQRHLLTLHADIL